MIKGDDIRRSYSICSTSSDNELRVAVKEVENGLFSSFANRELKTGDTMDVMVPNGTFTVSPNAGNTSNYVFYAAGSGITPIMSMIRSILETESGSQIFLYYGNKTAADTIFKSNLDELAGRYPNFHLTYIFSREETGDSHTHGRIDEDKCAHFYAKELAPLSLDGIYGCGPQEMIETVKDFYISKGLLHKFHYELFTATTNPSDLEAPQPSTGGNVVNSDVTVIIDDEAYNFSLSTSGSSILQAAQDKGADVPFSCKGGVCCTCRAKILEGTVSMDMNFALEEDEVEQGFILTCQSHPTSERVIISYDEY